jgi:hypothetical protein
MITEHQVARLLHDAVAAAPIPASVAVDGVRAVRRRDRWRHGLAAVVVAGVAFAPLVFVIGTPVGVTTPPLSPDGIGESSVTASARLIVIALVISALVGYAGLTVATRRSSSLDPDQPRRGLMAAWGVLGLLALGPVPTLVSALAGTANLGSRWTASAVAVLVASLVAALVAAVSLSWAAFAARRRLQGRHRGAALQVVWLAAALVAAKVLGELLVRRAAGRSSASLLAEPRLLSAVGALAVAIACSVVLARREGTRQPLLVATARVGLVLSVSSVAQLVVLMIPPFWSAQRPGGMSAAGVTAFSLVAMGIATVCARAALPTGSRWRGWSTAVTGAVTGVAAVATLTEVGWMVWLGLFQPQYPGFDSAVAVVVGAVLSWTSLMLLDRRVSPTTPTAGDDVRR